jgi:ABC-type Fe3+-hydroxamate transport system substrate-binding protein
MITVYDDRNRDLTFFSPPKRVVSLVPSDTLSLVELGLEKLLVARTDYCDTPASLAERVPAIGGTKNPRVREIIELRPDLVLVNQEENSKSDVEELIRRNICVYIAFPKTVREGLAHFAKLARIFRAEEAARPRLRSGYQNLVLVEKARAATPAKRAFCPIWMKPLMTVHGATYISDMMDLVGAQNIFADRERRYPLAADHGKVEAIEPGQRDVRYPRITEAELRARSPELILLPTEPHPFSEADADYLRGLDLRTPHGGKPRILFVDGKDLSWYGARAIEGVRRLQEACR